MVDEIQVVRRHVLVDIVHSHAHVHVGHASSHPTHVGELLRIHGRSLEDRRPRLLRLPNFHGAREDVILGGGEGTKGEAGCWKGRCGTIGDLESPGLENQYGQNGIMLGYSVSV